MLSQSSIASHSDIIAMPRYVMSKDRKDGCTKKDTTVTLPEGQWEILVNGEAAGTKVLGSAESAVSVAPISAMVLVKKVAKVETENASNMIVPAVLATTAAAAVVAGVCLKHRKK